MIAFKILTSLCSRLPLTHTNTYPIIANLFRKRNKVQSASAHPHPHPAPGGPQVQQKQEQKLPEDEQYDFFERRKQIDTSFDFSKMKEAGIDAIPSELGKGGFQQVLYWSQNAKNPEQIIKLISAFNQVASPGRHSTHQVHLEQFKQKVTGTAYLADSLHVLYEYSLFGYRYELLGAEFWQKIQFRCIKIFPSDPVQQGLLVDMGFMMGQLGVGERIFNHISKLLQEESLNIDQCVKLYLTFHLLKQGEKPWIDKLVKGIRDQMHMADQEQLTGVLGALKQAKSLPENINENIEKRVIELIELFSLPQMMAIVQYFGFEHQTESTWRILEGRVEALLVGRPMQVHLLEGLVNKILITYRFSADFVRKHIVQPIERNMKLLQQLAILSLSGLSKGLYIYELQGETRHLQNEISGLVIGKVTAAINELTDREVVKIIQDYNLTRNGNRELYIFFEEVVRVRYLRGYDHEVHRHTVEMLLKIYENSGMCSREMYTQLESLILE